MKEKKRNFLPLKDATNKETGVRSMYHPLLGSLLKGKEDGYN